MRSSLFVVALMLLGAGSLYADQKSSPVNQVAKASNSCSEDSAPECAGMDIGGECQSSTSPDNGQCQAVGNNSGNDGLPLCVCF